MKRRPTRRLQIAITFQILVIGLLSWILSLSLIYTIGRERLKERIGTNFQKIAEETAKNLASTIEEHIEASTALSLSRDLQEAVERSNHEYDSGQRALRISILQEAWSEGTQSPLVRGILQDPASELLRAFARDNPRREEHYLLFATDAQGFLVAADVLPSQPYFGNQAWWKATFDEGRGSTFVSDIEEMSFVPGAEKGYLLTIAVPVRDSHTGRAIGVFAMVHPVQRFFELVTQVKVAKTDHTMLAGSDGNLLFCPIFLIKNHRIEKDLMKVISQKESGWGVTFVDVHYPNRESINGFAPFKLERQTLSPSSLGGHSWYIFTSQDPSETYEPIKTLLNWTAMAGIIGVGMLALLGLYLTRRIVQPIHLLTDGAQRVGAGELDHQISIQTGDEIEELATSFNHMASRIKESHWGLEQKVAERTADLERRNQELSTLYAVVSTLGRSLNLGQLLNEVLDQIQSIFNVSAGMIHIWDAKEDLLLLKAHRGLSDALIEKMGRIRAGQDFCGKVMQTGEAVFLSGPVVELGADPRGPRNPMRADRDFLYGLSLPLKSKGTAVGTLSLLDRGDRAFSEQDYKLLLSICSQIAVAVENARLFEETRLVDQLKSDFVSKVSHEFRTPLTSIRGFAEILMMYGEVPPAQKEFLQIISQESDRLTRLINDVLDLSKIEAGKIAWHLQPVDIEEIIVSAARSIQSLAREKEIFLEVRIPPRLPKVYADVDQLIQVINNLLSNAIKFTPKGSITVSARPQGEQEVLVSVSDTGIGIPAEELTRIFEKFHQVSSPHKTSSKGTGLGLAICKEIVLFMSGKIWCESTLGEGSTFYFTLPVAGKELRAPGLIKSR